MSKRRHFFRFSMLFCWVLLIVGAGIIAPHTVAHAASFLPSGYTLTVTESASTMTYGDTAPNFQAQLTVPTGENPLRNPALFNFMIDSQDYAPDTSELSDSTYIFTLKGSSLPSTPPLSAGQHAVVASYFSIPLNETLESAPVTLTVQKLTPTIDCEVQFVTTFATKAPVTFTLSTEAGPAVDWPDATYTMTFIGSQTFTDTNLTADSSGQVIASTPPVPGMYTFRCTFNGTANFNSASVTGSSTLVVSANHQPTIKLYSNPTTIKAGQSTTLEIVVSGGPGLPTPTGQFGLYMGNMFIRPTNLGANGSAEVQTTFPSPLPANTIEVDYFGDTVYTRSSATFPLTNPPISGGSNNPHPTPTPTSKTTPTPSSTGASTPTPSSTAIANVGTTSNNGTSPGSHTSGAASNQGGAIFWIALMVCLVLAASGSGVFLLLRKRARAPATPTFPFREDF